MDKPSRRPVASGGYNFSGMLELLERPALRKVRAIQLSVNWESRGESFRESLTAFLAQGQPAKNGQMPNFFRDTYIQPFWPFRSFVASVFCHAAFISFLLLPIWNFQTHRTRLAPVRIELTWNQPSPDLAPLTYAGTPAQPSPPGDPSKRTPRRGANAFHPRQTILSSPHRLTHPRQTLIQPGTSPAPPKIASRMPNIAEWSQMARASGPRLRLRPSAAAPRGPRRLSQRAGMPPAPELQNAERNPGLLNFAGGPVVNPQPRLPEPASSTPRIVSQEKPANVNAPEIGSGAKTDEGLLQLNLSAADPNAPKPKMPVGPDAAPRVSGQQKPSDLTAPDINVNPQNINLNGNDQNVPEARLPASSSGSPTLNKKAPADVGPAPDLGAPTSDTGRRIIALSASPAPPALVTSVPAGNLTAKVAISPQGTQPGVPGGSPTGVAEGTGGIGGAGGTKPGPGGGGAAASGPTGVSITGGNPKTASTVAGPGSNVAEAPPTPARVNSPAANGAPATAQPEPVNPARTLPTLGMERIDGGASPEQIFGAKRFYTTYVNMPNLTSATGSWVLNFAELFTGNQPNRSGGELSSPVPVRKVDPKYPPTLINAHVEGEVVLYAIIRRDGSVDSIQLLKGVDPQLDQNAMEAFSRWKFRPATLNGASVDLETVVHIPFRMSPAY